MTADNLLLKILSGRSPSGSRGDSLARPYDAYNIKWTTVMLRPYYGQDRALIA